MPEYILAQNRILKLEADELLHKKKVLQILNVFGRPFVSGSYALDLMTWRDLDIYLETESITGKEFFQLGSDLCTALSPARMSYRNEELARTAGLPAGLYWGVYLGDEREGAWKVDVWAVCETEGRRLRQHCEAIKRQLNHEVSTAILSIKSQCWQDPDYRRAYTSTDIYEAVLTGGVRDIDGFWSYLNK